MGTLQYLIYLGGDKYSNVTEGIIILRLISRR
jgi:hypothetical protein